MEKEIISVTAWEERCSKPYNREGEVAILGKILRTPPDELESLQNLLKTGKNPRVPNIYRFCALDRVFELCLDEENKSLYIQTLKESSGCDVEPDERIRDSAFRKLIGVLPKEELPALAERIIKDLDLRRDLSFDWAVRFQKKQQKGDKNG